MTISPYEEAHFLREGIVDINAAVVGISRARWTYLEESDATKAQAEAIMRQQRFDVLPVANGAEVKKYFCTHKWNDYSSISQETITHRDGIPFHTHIRDVIKGLALECGFHAKTATDSRHKLPPMPRAGCHGCHRQVATPPVVVTPRATRGAPRGLLRFAHLVREEPMPAQRGAMRHVSEGLRRTWGQGRRDRQSAQSLGRRRPAGAAAGRRAEAAGVSWPVPAPADGGTLDRGLVPSVPASTAAPPLVPQWATVPPELTRQGVTVCLRWQEAKAATPDGVQDRWCGHTSRAWARPWDRVMRQPPGAGEQRCGDAAGPGLPGVNRHSGEGHEAVMCVAVLGASSSTYAEATWTQSLPDGIGAQVRTCAALGGVPERVVPDHRTAAVTRAHRYAPERNRTSTDLAQPSGCAVIPARAATPREKAKVAVGGHVVERWMLARLRPHTCVALAEVHAALAPLLSTRKARPCKTLPGSRQERCDTRDRPALRPLLAQP